MSTIGMVLAWIVCGIIALVGGGVVGMALANLLNPKRRANNYVAWRVFTGQSGSGDVFIFKNKMIAAKIRDVLDGKQYTSHYPKRKNKTSIEEYGPNDEDSFRWPHVSRRR